MTMLTFRSLPSVIVHSFVIAHHYTLLPRCASASSSSPITTTTTTLPTDEHGDYNGADLIDWIRSHPDGAIHPSLRIGREKPGDTSSPLGLFVSDDASAVPISKGDVIARIPWDLMIQPGGRYHPYKFFSCRAIYNLANELELGDKSERAPYVRYLLSQTRGTMPGEWSEAGSRFLAKDVLGDGDLPPYEGSWRTKFDTEWLGGCSGTELSSDPHAHAYERAAYWLASSRDEDTLMVPVYDMANHSNDPDLLNTLSYKPEKAGDAFLFKASRDIARGEQLYNSYNRCNVCSDAREGDCETYSYARTPDLFVGFGFVEDYPQNWEFDPHNGDSGDDEDDTEFEFCLNRDAETGKFAARWGDREDDKPDAADVRWLRGQLGRLRALAGKKERLEGQLVRRGGTGMSDEEADDKDKMSRWEWESAWRYHAALSRAIAAAILSVTTEDWHDGEL